MECTQIDEREMYSEIEDRDPADYKALGMKPPEEFETFGAWLGWFLVDYLRTRGDNKVFIDMDCSLAQYMDWKLEQLEKANKL